MLVKAKELQIGDRIGLTTIIEISAILPKCIGVKAQYKKHIDSYHFREDDEIAIHRDNRMIWSRENDLVPFSKEKLKRSIYKAILDLPEEEWDFGHVQQIVDDIYEYDPTRTEDIRKFISRLPKWNWVQKYASYHKQ